MPQVNTIYRLHFETGATWVMRVDAALQGTLVRQLRHAWRRIEPFSIGVPVALELMDARSMDPAGRELLEEMRRSGVQIVER